MVDRCTASMIESLEKKPANGGADQRERAEQHRE
jgi:hypothetical protein